MLRVKDGNTGYALAAQELVKRGWRPLVSVGMWKAPRGHVRYLEGALVEEKLNEWLELVVTPQELNRR